MKHLTKHITRALGLWVALAGCGRLAAQYRDMDCGPSAFSPMSVGMQGSYGRQGYPGQPMGPMAGCCGDPNCAGCGYGPGVPMSSPGMPMNFGALKAGMHHAVHGTGPLRPGKVRAGMFGWIPPKFTGQAIQGYHPLANAYPYPYSPQPANPFEGYPGVAPGGGYINQGGTCCGPHWYDFMVEGVGLTMSHGVNVNLTSDGIADPVDQPDVVLSTNNANFNYQGGFRAGGRFQMNAVMAVEATYLGGLDWSSSATATSNNNGLFSVFSDFGNNPNGGFEDTDQATSHSVTLTSDLQSVDVLLRRMWVSPSQRHSGSWMFGVRYFQLNESLLHATIVDAHVSTVPMDPIPVRPDGFLNYNLDVRNDLVGPELGIEGAHCLTPGITLLGEARGGVYGNRASQTTVADSTTIRNLFGQPVLEQASATEVAYGASARAMLLWQFHPLAKLRGGYEVLYLDRVATSPANFNTQPFELPTRTVFIAQNDYVLYHGFNVAVELGW